MIHRWFTRAGTGAVAALALAAPLGLTTSPAAVASAERAEATAALDWLEAEFAANANTLGGFGGAVDWGLTADGLLALAAAGRTPDAAVDTFAAAADEFVTWEYGGATHWTAGAAAKYLLVLEASGRSSVVGGIDYAAELRTMFASTGSDRGRLMDRVPDPTWNVANGFGQALAVMALEAGDGAPTDAVDYLVDQQCPAGGFRLSYGTTRGCEDDAQIDADATSLALSALLSVDRTPEVTAALERGATYLLARQEPDGSFGGTGPTAAPNTNSTGLAAQFLRAAGYTAAADRAAAWIATCCVVADDAGGALAAEHGAIAYSPAALSAASGGIGANERDQWRRATAQAVLSFGLPLYGSLAADPIVDETTSSTTTTSTTPPSTTTTTVGASTTTTTTTPTSAGPTSAGPTSAAPSSGTPIDSAAVEVLNVESLNTVATDGVRSAGNTLATTGTDATPLASAALVSIAAGALLLSARRRVERR